MIFRFTMSGNDNPPIHLTQEKAALVIQSKKQVILTTDYRGFPVQINKAYLKSITVDHILTASQAERQRIEESERKFKELPQGNDYKKQRKMMDEMRKSLFPKLRISNK